MNKAKPQKILFISSYYWPDFSGVAVWFDRSIPHLVEMGFECDVLTVCTRRPDEAFPKVEQRNGFRVFRLGLDRHFTPVEGMRLYQWLLKHGRDYDLVHFQTPIDRSFITQMLIRTMGLRQVFTATLDDGPDDMLHSYRPFLQPFVRKALRLFDVFTIISPAQAANRDAAYPHERLFTRTLGVSVPEQRPLKQDAELRERLGLPTDKPLLLYIGAIQPRKGVELFVDGMRGILKRRPDVQLVIVGPESEPDYVARLHQKAAQIGPDNIIFHPKTDQPELYFRAADLMLFNSSAEGLGQTLLEAMAQGTPVIASRLPGITDFVLEPGRNSLVFEGETGFVDSVCQALEDPDTWEEMSINAHALALERFSIEVAVERYAKVYWDLLRTNKTKHKNQT